jgi:hypothetical protein
MEKLRGIALNVTQSTYAMGQYGESEMYVASFAVDGLQVRSESPWWYPEISDGDLVTVCGTRRRGFLKALAWQNLTERASGNGGLLSNWFTALFWLVLTVSGYQGGAGVGTAIPAIIATYFAVRAVRITAALRELDLDS